ncbi:MAG: hypothetical protein KAR40_09575 [Candidatus Sabulitectum sp.]|nr:hypothetical protein [Candidatus Sabulitectum sp.]
MKTISELQNIFEEITVNGGNADEVNVIHNALEELGKYRAADHEAVKERIGNLIFGG